MSDDQPTNAPQPDPTTQPDLPRFYVETMATDQGPCYVIKDRQTGSVREFSGGPMWSKLRADNIADMCNAEDGLGKS
jgi:hypothetical protein